MKCKQLKFFTHPSKQLLTLIILITASIISYAQPIQVANSTAGGPKYHEVSTPDCIIDIKIDCVKQSFNGVAYLYEVIIETNSPSSVMIEHSTITEVINMNDPRWRELTPTKFAFYIVEPFDLQVTGCNGVDYTVLNWPDCGACHVLHAIGCDDKVQKYPYAVYISTSSPESVVIENNWPLVNLIAQSNPRFTNPEKNLYIIRYANPFDLQMTNCDGQNFTANYWPTCGNYKFVGQKQTGSLYNDNPVVDKVKEPNNSNIEAVVLSNRNPSLSITTMVKESPVSVFLIGITHTNIRKEIVSDAYFDEGVNEIALGELPLGLYQIIIQQGNNRQLVKYAHTYE